MGRRHGQAARRGVGLALAFALAGCPSRAEKVPGPVTPTDPVAEPSDGGIDEVVEAQVAAIAAAMNHYGPAIHTCWSIAAADDFRVEGRIGLRVDLGAGGTAEAVEVESDDTGDLVLAACLVELWKRVEWPDSFAAGDSIRLPPLSFVAPAGQYVVSAAHAISYPLSGDSHATILLDYKNSGNGAAAMTALTLEPGYHVPLHTHSSTEILYVLKGAGELTSNAKKPTTVGRGAAIYLPAGAPHAFKVTGEEPLVALQLYVPGGAEQRFKGIDIGGTTQVEKIDRRAPAAVVRRHDDVPSLAISGGKVSLLFDGDSAPDTSASVAGMTIDAGSVVPAHVHESSTELLFILEGGGTLTVGGSDRDVGAFDAIQIPAGVEHSFRNDDAVTKAIQFYSPSGPERRWKP